MDNVEKAVDLLVKHMSEQQNILKVVEECAELQEVMVKYLTKREDLKPKLSKLVEEMGDVQFRIQVAARMLGIEGSVKERVKEKAYIMANWAEDKFETFKN